MSGELITTLARGLCLGEVFADDVGKLAPSALKLLDDGLRDIADRLVPRNSAQASQYHNNQFPGELSTLLNRVGLRKGAPSTGNDFEKRWEIFLDPKNDRNWRLENCLVGCRVWGFQNAKGVNPVQKPSLETYYQLVKFRGIDLNDPASF